jgi:hypothetical protein
VSADYAVGLNITAADIAKLSTKVGVNTGTFFLFSLFCALLFCILKDVVVVSEDLVRFAVILLLNCFLFNSLPSFLAPAQLNIMPFNFRVGSNLPGVV